jgi:hypothetical protein
METVCQHFTNEIVLNKLKELKIKAESLKKNN